MKRKIDEEKDVNEGTNHEEGASKKLASNGKKRILVDMRSDTVTLPTEPMLKAMFEAEVGDDVKDEDYTVNQLQEKVAKLCGKESALFVCR